MSRLDKFINHPIEFFDDAFKKREEWIANKINLTNAYFKKVGVPVQLDLDIVKQSFIRTAVNLSHNNEVGNIVLALISLERQSDDEIVNKSLSSFEIIPSSLRNLLKNFSHLLSGQSIKKFKLRQLDPTQNLSPEAKVIYLDLSRKLQEAGDRQCVL